MTVSPAARPDAIRRYNLALMLREIHRDGALTRAQLTKRLGVSRSTIAALVTDLIEAGLVQESVPSGGERAGRPSHVVGPHANGPYVVAVDLDVTHLTAAAVGIGGLLLARDVVTQPGGPPSPHSAARTIRDSVLTLQRETGRTDGPVGVAVSVPGTVDRRTGHVGTAPNLGWNDVEFGKLLAATLPTGLPVVVGNDADLAVLAEHRRGSARGCDDIVYVMGRAGVGAGIIVNGAPLRGHDGHAGEIGHNVVDASGPPCHCGNNGCVETYVGDGALVALAGTAGPPTDEAVAAVFAAAGAGEPAASGAVREVAEALGRALAGIANVLNPQRVLLGGSLTYVLRLARPEIESAVSRYAFEGSLGSVELVEPSLGADAALLGAAEVAFAALLADPLGAVAQLG